MYTCACCNIVACCQENPEKKPGNCPMLKKELMDEAFQAYALSENHEFYIKSSELADLGYDQWPRLKETVKMCEAMGYKRVGLAFCRGLHKEAKIVDGILRRAVEAGKILVMTTQVPNEGSDLGVYHVGGRLKQNLRLLEAYDMTTEAAVAKLMYIMGRTRDFDEVERLFYAPVAQDILYSNS